MVQRITDVATETDRMRADRAGPVIHSLVLALLLHHLVRRRSVVDDGAAVLAIAGHRHLEQWQAASQCKVALIDVADTQSRSSRRVGIGSRRVHNEAVPSEAEVRCPLGPNRYTPSGRDALMHRVVGTCETPSPEARTTRRPKDRRSAQR